MRSLRSKLILASILWTSGLLMLMHMLSMLFLRWFPKLRGAHSAMAVLVAVFIMLAGFQVVRRSLRPFGFLQGALTAVRTGRNRRVEGDFPIEVAPLIAELNELLEEREKAVQRAFVTAGDLAHGLKTPLALLAQEADRIAASGNRETAENIGHQVDRMSRQITYHLARARASASAAASAELCSLMPSVDALLRTLAKLYAGRSLTFSSNISAQIRIRIQHQDLEEIVGNLLDNACKWARTKVEISAILGNNSCVVTIEDDGPGLAPASRLAALERGVRFDEAGPGSGLGLAIVRDLVETYGGTIVLSESALGGLTARITLPSALELSRPSEKQ